MLNNKTIISLEGLGKDLENYTLVKTNYLISLTDDSNFLGCLEAAGVDNWSGYDDARQMYNEDEE